MGEKRFWWEMTDIIYSHWLFPLAWDVDISGIFAVAFLKLDDGKGQL